MNPEYIGKSTDELSLEAATAAAIATAQSEAISLQPIAINLLEVMEICSELCACASGALAANLR